MHRVCEFPHYLISQRHSLMLITFGWLTTLHYGPGVLALLSSAALLLMLTGS